MTLHVVVMGVSGGGKSTLGRALAQRMGAAFVDADDLHPAANIAWMESGEPLTDEMRMPWLDMCGAAMCSHARVVLACSALTASYRDRLRAAVPNVRFVYPQLTYEIVAARLAARENHFMPASLLTSQFATLEPPSAQEAAIYIAGDLSIERSVDAAAAALRA